MKTETKCSVLGLPFIACDFVLVPWQIKNTYSSVGRTLFYGFVSDDFDDDLVTDVTHVINDVIIGLE